MSLLYEPRPANPADEHALPEWSFEPGDSRAVIVWILACFLCWGVTAATLWRPVWALRAVSALITPVGFCVALGVIYVVIRRTLGGAR